MPRYLIETQALDAMGLDEAVALGARRFPEVAVEHRYTASGGPSDRDVWICRAPSDAHLGRWASEAGLGISTIRHVQLAPSTTESRHQTVVAPALAPPHHETRAEGEQTMSTAEVLVEAPAGAPGEGRSRSLSRWLAIASLTAGIAVAAGIGTYELVDVLDGPGADPAGAAVDAPAMRYGSADAAERALAEEPAARYGSADAAERNADR